MGQGQKVETEGIVLMTQETIPRNTIGMAGVFWVASELARRNWFAFPTVRNQKGVDIIATKEVPGRTKFIEIQVKATQYDTATFWLLTKERENIPHRESLFFVFVKPESKSAFAPFEAFVVPSTEVHEKARHSEKGTFALCWWKKESEIYRNGWDALDA
jgi:hypothetical protein